jgi:heme-degrading monooxygenase HmoA
MIANDRRKWGFVIAWEFRPKAGVEPLFEAAYGPDGIWAQLFRQGEGFVATELSRDTKDARRYLTLDFWESKSAYERFRADRSAHYARNDAQCESLTEFEREVGQFERVDR